MRIRSFGEFLIALRVACRAVVLCGPLALAACDLSSEPTGPVADVRGTWRYVGTQSAPALQLEGTLVVTQQRGDIISGSVTWEERDGFGDVQVKGGQMTGRVIGLEDIDFDVLLGEGDRRHVARVAGDSLDGVWAAVTAGRSGNFRASRQVTP
jgi:hypothetical protein